jgi:hypothetical protein
MITAVYKSGIVALRRAGNVATNKATSWTARGLADKLVKL